MESISPKISVIVPIFNVEEYLRECLDSLVNQTFQDIEVIMVNDGSTDNSAQIMEEYASKYDNFHAYHKENGGLASARNYGIQFAKGEYLAFLDSDDYVSRDAYAKLYDLAKKSGSEVVIGNTVRFNSKKIYGSTLHKKVFKETILNTHITKMPQLIYNTSCWNNLFLHDFWKKYKLVFPDITYEDIPVMIPSYFYSTSTSVLEDVIYYWRVREGKNLSLSQKRTEIRNFLDRMKSIQIVDDFYKSNQIIDEYLIIEKDYRFLSLDIAIFLNQLDRVDEEYIRNFVNAVNPFIAKLHPEAFRRLSAINKIKYKLLQDEKIEELLDVIRFEKKKLKFVKPEKRKGRYYIPSSYSSLYPQEMFDVTDELSQVCRIEEMDWEGNTLKIVGHTYIGKVDSKFASRVYLKATIKKTGSLDEIELPVKITKRKDVTKKYGLKPPNTKWLFFRRIYSYDWSGFEVHIDFDREDVFQLAGTGKLEVWFTLRVGNLERQFRVNGPVKGEKPRTHAKVIRGKWIKPRYNAAWELTLETEEKIPVLLDTYLQDDKLVFIGHAPLMTSDAFILLVGKKNSVQIPISGTDQNNFTAELQLEETVLDGDKYQVYIFSDNQQKPLYVPKNQLSVNFDYWRDREIHYKLTNNSTLHIWIEKVTPYIVKADWNKSRLDIQVFAFDFYNQEFDKIENELIVVESVETGKALKLKSVKNNENLLCANVPLQDEEGNLNFLDGKWAFFVEVEGVKDGKTILWKKRIQQPPQGKIEFAPLIYSKQRFKPYISKNGYFKLSVKLVWSIIDRGPKGQKVLRKIIYPLLRRLPLDRRMIVFQAYWGQSYRCNPRALYEYIQEREGDKFKYIWVFKNENTPIQGKAIKIREKSWKYYYYMARAKFFVNNVNFPDYYEKRKGAIEIQTLHGTFLKTMGLDVPGDFNTPQKKEMFLRKCRRWDYVITPSRYMTEKARSCFQYDREVLEIGFPRNDVLFQSNNESLVQSLKTKLDLPSDKRIILYAPTWRVKNKFQLQLDLELMHEKLSGEYVVLLRLHHLVAGNIDIDPYRGFVFNVSNYGKIEDLYLVSDLLITDYSSAMFDYAILNRPMLFFTYDLEFYRDKLRGMYIDFEQEAPGPLLRTTEEIIEAIQNLDRVAIQYAEKLKRFREKYCEFETGKACEYVLEQVIKAHR